MNIDLLQKLILVLLSVLLIILALANAVSEGNSNLFKKIKHSFLGQRIIKIKKWFELYGEEVIFFALFLAFVSLILEIIF